MQLLFYLLLFVLAVQSCQGLVLAQKLKAAGLICTVGTWFLWPQQPGSRNKTIAAGSVVDEHADVRRIGAREYPTFIRIEPSEARIGAEDHLALRYPQAKYRRVEAGENLKYVRAETNETSIGVGEQLRFLCTEESTSTRAESPNRSAAPIGVEDTTAAATTTHKYSYLHSKATNPTIFVRPEILKQRSRQNFFSATASTLCCCLATIFVLVIYQLLVYGSSLHIWLYDLCQKISANATCLAIGAIGNLPPQATDVISSINQLPLRISSRTSNGFRRGSDCNNIVSPETIYQELRKLRRARDHQSLEANRLHTLKRKRRVNIKVTKKRAAKDFKQCHNHWHGIFEEGIADILRQVSEYSHMEQQLNSISALCTEAEKSLVSHVTKISNLLEQLDSQMQQLAVAIPNSTTSLRDMQSLVTEINKLLTKSKSADAQVHRAERIIKTLYNVGERMQMAPFTDTLKSIAEASADAQRIIYNAESAIVAASFAQRDPNQLFGPAIVAAREAQCPLPQNLLSGLSASPEKTIAEAPIAEQLSPSAVIIGDTPLSTEINGDVSTSPHPSPSAIDSELPPPEVKMGNEATTPRRLSSTVITTNSPPLDSPSRPQSPLVLMPNCFPTHCLADPKDESMAKMSPGWGSFLPNTAPEEVAVRGKDCANHFGHLSELQELEDTTKFSSTPLAIPNQPLVFSSRTQEFGKFRPKVPTHRWNAPKRGILQKTAPGATSTVLKAPLRDNVSASKCEFKPAIASAPALPTVSIATIKSEPSEPTISETDHRTGALKSNRINQAVFDQIQLTGAREIKKAVSRLAKPGLCNPPAGHVSANQPQGTPITAPEVASEGAPENAPVEDDRAFPAYDGDSTFEELFANIGGCGYTMDPRYNTDSSYGGNPLNYSDSRPNDAFAYNGYTPYSGDNDEDAYGPSNVVYPVGYEEILGPIADYQIDAAGLDNYDFFNNGLLASYPPFNGDQIDITGLENYDFLNDDGLPASYPPLNGDQIDATGLNYYDFLNDDRLPASYPLLDDVSRLLNEDWNGTSHVDALLLAERAGDDGNDSDGDDHQGNEYNSDTNGYGTYGNLSDYDSDQL